MNFWERALKHAPRLLFYPGGWQGQARIGAPAGKWEANCSTEPLKNDRGTRMKRLFMAAVFSSIMTGASPAADEDLVFDFQALLSTPLNARILKPPVEKDGIVTEEVMFHSEMDGEKSVDIFAFFSHPGWPPSWKPTRCPLEKSISLCFPIGTTVSRRFWMNRCSHGWMRI